jgi:hypothetical protein
MERIKLREPVRELESQQVQEAAYERCSTSADM